MILQKTKNTSTGNNPCEDFKISGTRQHKLPQHHLIQVDNCEFDHTQSSPAMRCFLNYKFDAKIYYFMK